MVVKLIEREEEEEEEEEEEGLQLSLIFPRAVRESAHNKGRGPLSY